MQTMWNDDRAIIKAPMMHQPKYNESFFWPQAQNTQDYIMTLFFTPDGLFSLSLVLLFCIGLYWVINSYTKEGNIEEKTGSDILWKDHETRFTFNKYFVGGPRYKRDHELSENTDDENVMKNNVSCTINCN